MVPNITITPVALADLYLAIDLCPVEIEGLGIVERYGDEHRIVEILIFPQRCSFGGTLLDRHDPNSVMHFWSALARAGKAQDTAKQKLWWHSHVDGGVSFSGTDFDNIETFARNACNLEELNPWLISLVLNKRHDIGRRLDVFWPNRQEFTRFPLKLLGKQEQVDHLYYERIGMLWKKVTENVVIVPGRELYEEKRRN